MSCDLGAHGTGGRAHSRRDVGGERATRASNWQRAWRAFDVHDGSLIGPFSREPWTGGSCTVASSPRFDDNRPGIYGFADLVSGCWAFAICPVTALVDLLDSEEVDEHLEADVNLEGTVWRYTHRGKSLRARDCRIVHLFVAEGVTLNGPQLVAIPTTVYTSSPVLPQRLVDLFAATHGIAGVPPRTPRELDAYSRLQSYVERRPPSAIHC